MKIGLIPKERLSEGVIIQDSEDYVNWHNKFNFSPVIFNGCIEMSSTRPYNNPSIHPNTYSLKLCFRRTDTGCRKRIEKVWGR